MPRQRSGTKDQAVGGREDFSTCRVASARDRNMKLQVFKEAYPNHQVGCSWRTIDDRPLATQATRTSIRQAEFAGRLVGVRQKKRNRVHDAYNCFWRNDNDKERL